MLCLTVREGQIIYIGDEVALRVEKAPKGGRYARVYIDAPDKVRISREGQDSSPIAVCKTCFWNHHGLVPGCKIECTNCGEKL